MITQLLHGNYRHLKGKVFHHAVVVSLLVVLLCFQYFHATHFMVTTTTKRENNDNDSPGAKSKMHMEGVHKTNLLHDDGLNETMSLPHNKSADILANKPNTTSLRMMETTTNSSSSTTTTTPPPTMSPIITKNDDDPLLGVLPLLQNDSKKLQDPMTQQPSTKNSSLADKEGRVLPLLFNPNVSIAESVQEMWYDETTLSVYIQMKPNTKCSRPSLRGRLSGPYLIMLEWSTTFTTTVDNNDNSTTSLLFRGSFHVPEPGRYFLEIIVLFCQDFTQVFHTEEAYQLPPSVLPFNFTDSCMESIFFHRLTLDGQSIHVPTTSLQSSSSSTKNKNDHSQPPGYWIHENYYNATTLHNDTTFTTNSNDNMNRMLRKRIQSPGIEPMFTRVQPYKCGQKMYFQRFQDKCGFYQTMRRFNPYQFHWDPSLNLTASNVVDYYRYLRNQQRQQIQQNQSSQSPSLEGKPFCLLGASHSRYMTKYADLAKIKFVRHVDARYPKNITDADDDDDILQGCHAVLIAIGQWPASYASGVPILFDQFYQQTKEMILKIQTAHPKMQIYMRDIHDVPLGDSRVVYCPPKDWRSPPVIMGYNKIIRQVLQEINQNNDNNALPIQYIDTNFLTRPMWDSSKDWCHLRDFVATEEAIYISAIMIGYLSSWQQKDSIVSWTETTTTTTTKPILFETARTQQPLLLEDPSIENKKR